MKGNAMGYGYRAKDNEDCVMLEPFEGLECDDEFERQFAWQDMKAEILSALPPSLVPADSDNGREWVDDAKIIARGKLHIVTVQEDDGGYGYAYVTVKPRESWPDILRFDEEERQRALAVNALPLVSRALFRKLANAYPLRVPNGYTSTAYQGG